MAAENRSGASVHCHRAGPGPGGEERRRQQQQQPEGEGQEEEEEEEEEEERHRGRSRLRGRHEPETQGRAELGLAAPCTVKQELGLEEQQQQQQEEEDGEEAEEEEDGGGGGGGMVKVEAEPEETGLAAGQTDCSLYPAGQEQSEASGREQQQRRILIIDEQRQRVEEAVLCQEVEWDRTDRQASGLVWQRVEAWGPDADESGKVLVSVAGVRGQEQHPPTTLQSLPRDRPGSSPAQRRRKSEYPRRRSCISFTFGGAELSTGHPEEGEEPVEIRDLQRFGTAHRVEPVPELPVLKTAPVVLMKTKLGRGRWRAKSTCEEPESDPTLEPQWESQYWEKASPSAYAVPEIHTHVVNSAELSREHPADTQPAAETETMQLICESVPDPDQKDESISLAGLAAAAGLPNSVREPELENSEEDEPELVETDDDIPFHDDPKDEMYEPSPHRERGKPRRKPRKEKEKVETVEQVEPPKSQRRPRRSKEDRGPRPPKKRKKPPIQYVRCEMEGCGTILANPRYLQHHMRYQHMLKKKYVCPHPSCGRLFRLQKQLLRHTKHHSDQRDYICEYCARAFKSSHNLAVHRMIHTGEKPLQCEICGFTCRQKASLNWHMKKHDADANYQFSCNMCGKKFEKKDSVVAHKSKSHPELVIAEALAESAECTVLDPCSAP
ncbi:E3 ubiquitin-protein ligase ZFP91-like isoform X3 [Chiloscyllium plagiosum]|uniref:E3 ubiquitin-protein ligase ZFP91-like isoform X3 n=1 Tax=Chiloscyllium plagiosum TaxID=36176 RepID=UPI001CB86205|nr:E3 ubiquitin-protein ligase ZFP91-like isoform X3 [Chiloscyllium plagiosum]